MQANPKQAPKQPKQTPARGKDWGASLDWSTKTHISDIYIPKVDFVNVLDHDEEVSSII